MNKPFSEACEQNKEPILAVLRQHFATVQQVVEIGSGTGQHAVYFAQHLPHLLWRPGDLSAHLAGINLWIAEAGLPNVLAPVVLDVNDPHWFVAPADGVFSANTTHIMSWPEVVMFFDHVGQVLQPGGIFCLYGPFNYHGQYSSDSNARFDTWLKARDPHSGIRDVDDLALLAHQQGWVLLQDYAMPVNNRTLVWRKPKDGV